MKTKKSCKNRNKIKKTRAQELMFTCLTEVIPILLSRRKEGKKSSLEIKKMDFTTI